MSSEYLGMWPNHRLLERCRLAATAEPVWLSSFTNRTPLIALMCTLWRVAWCFLSHGTLSRRISCENVLKSVAEELDLRPPRLLLLRPFQLHGVACSSSQKIKPGSQKELAGNF